MGRSKKDKVSTPPKKATKKRAEAKPPPEAETGATVCKDFVGLRWETTEEGQLAVWQAAEEDELGTLSTLPGSIVSVMYDKHCGLVYESEGDNQKKTKKTVWHT